LYLLDLVTDYAFASVPVIAVFTKFDALWDDAYGQLKSSGLARRECSIRAPERAKEIFANAKIWDRLRETKHPPKDSVCMAGKSTCDFVYIVYYLVC
jgi:hypothetical protein